MIELSSTQKVKLNRDLQYAFGEKLLNLMNAKNITDITLNKSKIWAKFGYENEQYMFDFDIENANRIIRLMSTVAGIENIQNTPIINAQIPFNGARFASISPPICETPTFSIRIPSKQIYTLSDLTNGYCEQSNTKIAKALTNEQKTLLQTALLDKKNILIIGAMGSGKTTMLNAMLDFISTNKPEKIAVFQDTTEIQTNSEQVVILTSNEKVTLSQLIMASLRHNFKRLILGEVRGAEALQLIKMWNTGHRGGICTIHADGCLEALYRLEQLIGEATQISQSHLIASTIDLLVFMQSGVSGPFVKDIKQVRFDGGRYELK
jgi:Flp pilus assembly CpaF family ATPase